ncbi:MAG: GNAT family N-acetyltransferase [Dehalococcoidia bacterium]|nr:GNAT family N-acetyltransferase [Dehalococcoidia bacterium]
MGDPCVPDVMLRSVTKENVAEVLRLRVHARQEHLVAPNAVSIAEAYFEPAAWFQAIYAGDEPVGFIMVAHDAEEGTDYLWRMMVAGDAQGRGYGGAALRALIDYTRRIALISIRSH